MATQLAVLRICYFVLLCHHVCDACPPEDNYQYQYMNELRALTPKRALKAQIESDEEDVWPPKPELIRWFGSNLVVGQISGVTVNPAGEPVIFHRGNRVWDERSFNGTDIYQLQSEGPINDYTVLVLHPMYGIVLEQWGMDMFYLPHGITSDYEGNIWLTDVALHQVFKFAPGLRRPLRTFGERFDPGSGVRRPQMTFGQRFEPGSGVRHLCKPTSVAVARTGEIFIADGYCNSRILKFDKEGNFMRVFPQKQEFLSLQVPHSLALLEHRDLLCIADRDNMRVACIGAKLHDHTPNPGPVFTIQEPDLGRVYGIASHGDLVYAVNGYTSPMIPIQGFTLDPLAETIVDHWGPTLKNLTFKEQTYRTKPRVPVPVKIKKFHNPHAIAISPNGELMFVSEIGPNRIWKFRLRPQVPAPMSMNRSHL